MRAAAAVLMALGFVSVALTQDDAVKAELDKVHGNWIALKVNLGGQAIEFPEGGQPRFTFKAKKVISDKNEELFTFELDPSVKPPIMDFTNLKDKKQVLEGIYKIEGDTLTVCLHNGQGVRQRPSEFDIAGNANLILITLKKDN